MTALAGASIGERYFEKKRFFLLSKRMMENLIHLRHKLHAAAEKSGAEENTARIVSRYLDDFKPDRVIRELGGHGIAAVFNGHEPGPRLLIRCELDALPIPETIKLDYGAAAEGVAHKCGHDGHMTIVLGLAPVLRALPPRKGSVVLLFQPAEETGKGAGRVIEDSKFAEITPDYCFALHNLPGFARHRIIIREGFFAAASKGLIVKLRGATSHAAEPEKGNSPTMAVVQLIHVLSSMPQLYAGLHEASKVTVIHSRLGEIAFGTSPGEAEVMATLRTYDQGVMKKLSDKCLDLVGGIARANGLRYEIDWDEAFPATINNAACAELIKKCASRLNLDIYEQERPFPWSEDFGNFTSFCPGVLFGLGAGEDHPVLHHPTYDFPDEIIDTGVKIFEGVIREWTG
jgi:amidohydrolase